jgi:2-C-methyl-D-erythritol 4-phosphate cytidylyltransferase
LNKFAIIVAGGTGIRMGSTVPKQFLQLAGRPVLMHSIQAFHEYSTSVKIVIVLPSSLFSDWEALCEANAFNIPHKLCEGGKIRYDSVKNALSLINADSLVAIHDGVRPLVSADLISRSFDHASDNGNAIPVTYVTDSARIINGSTNTRVDRSSLRLIQTPQVFEASLIIGAYQRNNSDQFTDDAGVLEAAGTTINLIQGDPYNFKITYPEDLVIAEALLKYQQNRQ